MDGALRRPDAARDVGHRVLVFGMLKFFPGLSPAQTLAVKTIDVLAFGLLPSSVGLVLLALLECAISLGLISGRFIRLTLLLLAFQMVGAASPLFLFPAEVFTQFPYAPTLEGQYIIKNLVLIGAGLVLGATARGGRIITDPPYIRDVHRNRGGGHAGQRPAA